MRRVLHGDLVQLGRVLYAHDADERRALIERAFAETRVAHQHRLATGLWHPEFGDGSLAGWASGRRRPPEPDLDDPVYAYCLMLILRQLARGVKTSGPRASSWDTIS